MGTRGFITFVIDGQEKTTYNHFDSYPSGLGVDVLGWLHNEMVMNASVLPLRARALRVVSGDAEPTDEEIEQLGQFYNPNVGGRSDRPTWYQLLRETQGNPGAILRAGVMEDASGFPTDSLFAEYGYVVDFDAKRFEAYEGFQKAPHDKGRFADRAGRDGYCPVALVASWPLGELPTNDDFCAAFDSEADE